MTTHTVRLDVRPILASGRDPLSEIMLVAQDVPRDGVLIVVAPFNPVPLRDLLGRSGFTSSAVALGPQDWEITFCRNGTITSSHAPLHDAPKIVRAHTWVEGQAHHLDARGMAPEAALQAVLAALDASGRGATLVVHLDASIDALYPELARRDCEAAFVPGNLAEVRLEISTPG